MADECIFCKIAAHEVPANVVYENDKYIAFLDVFPNIKGQTLVVPKKHIGSYFFDLEAEDSAEFMSIIKNVAKMLEKGLGTPRIHLVFEGTGINHLHVKLYPAIGLEDKNKPVVAEGTASFDSYEGYITTKMGPRADESDLKETKERIINASK